MVAIKREGLLLQNIHDEILVFNPDRSEATALNESAALVFELCDGDHDVDSIRTALDDAGLGPATDDAVWLALTELAEAGLVDLTVEPASHLGRRELLKKIGIGAAATAAALPVVETIAAPSAAAQGSGPIGGGGDVGGMTPAPTMVPTTLAPTAAPTTPAPTTAPTTVAPTPAPTMVPSTMAPTTMAPTMAPTTMPPTPAPTVGPTIAPTTMAPTTMAPTPMPSPIPTSVPL